jgi:hypothetical protein
MTAAEKITLFNRALARLDWPEREALALTASRLATLADEIELCRHDGRDCEALIVARWRFGRLALRVLAGELKADAWRIEAGGVLAYLFREGWHLT